jgi:hypothetical protein
MKALAALLLLLVVAAPADAQRRRYAPSFSAPPAVRYVPLVQQVPVARPPAQQPAPQVAQSKLDRKVDGSTHYNEDRVTDLPAGEQKLYTTVTVSDGWQQDPRQKAIVDWFRTDARLVRLRAQTHYNEYTPSNPHFKQRLRASYGDAVPMVTVQQPDGQILLHVTAKSMPQSPGELADMVDDSLAQKFAPPRFATSEPQIVSDCPDDNCYPDQPDQEPLIGPVMPEVTPNDVAPWNRVLTAGAVLAGVALVALVGFELYKSRSTSTPNTLV